MKTVGNVDSHFVIGKKHITQSSPCQDHALSGMIDDTLVVVISDGCSSGRHTDIGARIITCATMTAIKQSLAITRDMTQLPHLIHQTLIEHAQQTMTMMGLSNQDVLATCVYAVVTPEGGFIHILGDGHVAIKYRNGDTRLINTEWQNNTPYYPADSRKDAFIADHARCNAGDESYQIETVDTLGEVITTTTTSIAIEAAVQGYIIPLSPEELDSIQTIVVMSDGVGRFKKEGVFLDPAIIIAQLTAFKNWMGEFVKRRLSRGIHEFDRQGIIPDDDVAVAAIHVTKNQNV